MIDARNHGAGIRKLESRLKLLEEGKEASRRAKALESEADGLRSSVPPDWHLQTRSKRHVFWVFWLLEID